MRPAPVMLALALLICSISALAADVDFVVRSDAFEQSPPTVENFAHPTYEHPLYEGLWPMTLSAFLTIDAEGDQLDREIDFPMEVKQDAFLLANNENRPLRDSLRKSTREKFTEMEYKWGHFSR